MLDWLEAIYNAIITLKDNIVAFVDSTVQAGEIVGEHLVGVVSQVSTVLSFMPYDIRHPAIMFLGVAVTLAVVRWST